MARNARIVGSGSSADTNYALLLISRYREELGRTDDHRAALRVAVRHAAPAIVASNATVCWRC